MGVVRGGGLARRTHLRAEVHTSHIYAPLGYAGMHVYALASNCNTLELKAKWPEMYFR